MQLQGREKRAGQRLDNDHNRKHKAQRGTVFGDAGEIGQFRQDDHRHGVIDRHEKSRCAQRRRAPGQLADGGGRGAVERQPAIGEGTGEKSRQPEENGLGEDIGANQSGRMGMLRRSARR